MGLLIVVVTLCLELVGADQPLIIRDCASSSEPILQLKSVNVNPDPVVVPGDLTVSGTVGVNREVHDRGLDVDVTIERYVGFLWVTVPCISDVGSCRYDACTLLDTFQSGCPSQLVASNIPCTCDTITTGDLTMVNQRFSIPKLEGIWSWLASGDYKVTAKLIDRATNTEQGCIHVEATITDPDACSGFLCSIFG